VSIETDQFVIDEVEWNYVESREITGKPWRGQSVRTGIRSAKVTCKKCSHVWRATEGNKAGQILPVIGAARVECPNCGEEGPVHP
jgi:rubredoxin